MTLITSINNIPIDKISLPNSLPEKDIKEYIKHNLTEFTIIQEKYIIEIINEKRIKFNAVKLSWILCLQYLLKLIFSIIKKFF